ncbi:MAG: hypothetical protein ACKPKO_02395, partial [Candidatus Fonsibacter sp.]
MKKEYIQRCLKSYAPAVVIDSLVSVPLFKERKETDKSNNENLKWFSLPFHPAVRQVSISKAIRRFCAG